MTFYVLLKCDVWDLVASYCTADTLCWSLCTDLRLYLTDTDCVVRVKTERNPEQMRVLGQLKTCCDAIWQPHELFGISIIYQPIFFFQFSFQDHQTILMIHVRPFKRLQFYKYIVTLAHLIITWGFFVQLTSEGWFIRGSFEALLKISGRTWFLRVLQICLLRCFLEKRQWYLPHTFLYQPCCSSESNTYTQGTSTLRHYI